MNEGRKEGMNVQLFFAFIHSYLYLSDSEQQSVKDRKIEINKKERKM